MGGVESQESGRTLGRRRALGGGGLSPADPLSVLCQPGECLGQGAHCSRGSRTIALCLALMPAFQGSPKIGSGNSLKVITWDSGNSRWFLRAAPKCSRGCVLSCSLSGLSLFFMFISGRNPGSCIHEFSLSASPNLSLIPLFPWERKTLAPQSPLPHHGVQGNWPL